MSAYAADLRTARKQSDPVFESGLSASDIRERLALSPGSSESRALSAASEKEFTLVSRNFDQFDFRPGRESIRAANFLVIGGQATTTFDQPRLFDVTRATTLSEAEVDLARNSLPGRPRQ